MNVWIVQWGNIASSHARVFSNLKLAQEYLKDVGGYGTIVCLQVDKI